MSFNGICVPVGHCATSQILESGEHNQPYFLSYLDFCLVLLFVCFVFITGNCQKTSFTEILWLELGFRVRVRVLSKGM